MQKKVWKVLALAVGMLLAVGVPFPAVTAVQADPGCWHGCGCECGYPKDAGQAVPPCMQDNAATGPCGMHGMMHGCGGAKPMGAAMGKHMEEMRTAVKKLREIETKMAGQVKDGESFRALSLEHAKLLTDLQASHLKHMEGMIGGGK